MVQAQTQTQKQATKQEPAASDAKGWSNPCVAPTLTRGKAKIRLYHITAPTCWWSWGYYGTLARIRLVYGNQVQMNVPTFSVYDDLDHYLNHSGISLQGMDKLAKESAKQMGVPIFTGYSGQPQPKDTRPAMFAVLAAMRQGRPLGERFERALVRRWVVEGVDVTKTPVLHEAAKEAGLDAARFKRDLADQDGLRRDAEAQNEGMPNAPLGFYNLAVQDDRGRLITLDYAFEPADVESAIDYLSGGTLKKNIPNDPVAYLRATGPAHAVELARAFGWTPTATETRLKALAKSGQVKQVSLGGAPHWTA